MQQTDHQLKLLVNIIRTSSYIVPLSLYNKLCAKFIQRLWQKHTSLIERLTNYNGKIIYIQIEDLPFNTLFHLDSNLSKISLICSSDKTNHYHGKITGTLENLLALFEGKVDGDSLFFSRELLIEGETELILALRNAIDAEDFSLSKELLPFQNKLLQNKLTKPLSFLVKKGNHLFDDLNNKLNTLKNITLTDIDPKIGSLESQVSTLNKKIISLEKSINNKRKPSPPAWVKAKEGIKKK